MESHRQSGFTLIELVVALAILAILLGMGVPSFIDVMKNSRMSANYNALVGSLYLARSESVKSARYVTVCARATDSTCGGNWDNGWLVFVDTAPDLAAAIPGIGLNDVILSIDPEPEGELAITAFGSGDGTSGDAAASSFVRYEPDGSTRWANGYFRLCDTERGAEFSRAINIVLTGDIRRGRLNSADVPVNVFNQAIDC